MKKCTDLASERQGIKFYLPALAAPRTWDFCLTTDDFPFLMPCGKYGVVPRYDLPALERILRCWGCSSLDTSFSNSMLCSRYAEPAVRALGSPGLGGTPAQGWAR
jgi:hypothetical protein